MVKLFFVISILSFLITPALHGASQSVPDSSEQVKMAHCYFTAVDLEPSEAAKNTETASNCISIDLNVAKKKAHSLFSDIKVFSHLYTGTGVFITAFLKSNQNNMFIISISKFSLWQAFLL